MNILEEIKELVQEQGTTTIDNLAKHLNLSKQYIHQKIKPLLEQGELTKIGKAPLVYYRVGTQLNLIAEEPVSYGAENFLEQNFMLIDALGNKREGLEAMVYFTQNQKLPLKKTIDNYIKTRLKYLKYYNENHLISGLKKLRSTQGIGTIGVDELYYLDFYAIERYGKTNLGCLMHYAKQGQNKSLMREICKKIRNRLLNVIETENIDAIVYVPPTIPRKVQIMGFLEKELRLSLPALKVKKVTNEIAIPQKALSKLYERVANARNTFVVLEQNKYQKVLLLDDAVGSGATINEIALKLKSNMVAKEVVGLAITGSFKGFDVISEL